jgi:hypothetical protein
MKVAGDEVIEALGKIFKVQSIGKLDKFVRCYIIHTVEKDCVWIHQTKLLKNLKDKLKFLIAETAWIYKTPLAPKTFIKDKKEGDPLITPKQENQFRMGFGMLLYLDKNSRPYLSNSVRYQSMVAYCAKEVHFNVLLHTIKYEFDPENLGLLITKTQ